MLNMKTLLDMAEDSGAENVAVSIQLANGFTLAGVMPMEQARQLGPDLQPGTMLPAVMIEGISVTPELPPEPALDPARN